MSKKMNQMLKKFAERELLDTWPPILPGNGGGGTCVTWFYQPKVPEGVKKFRK